MNVERILEAERSVLGAILIDNDAFGTAAPIVEEGRTFFRDAHRRIFDHMAELAKRRQPIDLVTLKDALELSGDLEEVGGPAYIASLVDGVPRSTNVKYYARIVKEHHARRRLAILARTLEQGAREDEDLRDLVERVADLAHSAVDVSETGAPSTWRLVDDVQILDEPSPEPLVADVLARRSLAVIYSPPGTGKTTLAATLATAVATKRPFFGHEVKRRGSVCYIGPDDPSGWKPRQIAAKREYGIPLDEAIGVYLFPEAFELLDNAKVDSLIAFLAAKTWPAPLELIIIDTFAAVTPGADENSASAITKAMLNAQKLRDRLQAAVAVLHHTNASGSRERGHSAMRGAADTMLALVPSDDIVRLECSKQRNGAPFKAITLKLVEANGGGCVFRLLDDVEPTATLTQAQQKALDTLRDSFGADGATKSEWQRACNDMVERTFHRAAKRLQDLGLVRQSGPRFVVSDSGNDATDKPLTWHRTDTQGVSIGSVSAVTCQQDESLAAPRLIAVGRA